MDEGEQLELLKEAFGRFVQASDELKVSYDALKARAVTLERELRDVNVRLNKSLGETQRLSSYLGDLLNSMSTAIVVVDPSFKVTLVNPASMKLFPGLRKGRLLAKAAPLLERLPEDETWEKEFDEGGRFFLVSSGLIRNGKRAIGRFFLLKETTALKEMEAELNRSRQLTAMGEMAAELAHEIRNPLGSIELYASMLEEDLEGRGMHSDYAKAIREEIQRLNNLVTNTLLFTRQVEPLRRAVDVKRFLERIFQLFRPLWEMAGVEVSTRVERESTSIDPDLFERVILNLLLNSLEALRGRATPRIAIKVEGRGEETLWTLDDNGPGIPEEVKKKIFNPFFTTKSRGSGLGLSVCYRIVRAHGGKIRVEERAGGGTSVLVEYKEGSGD
ncbi:MAG TPA: ATP-binding protein [Candidatus Aminicenantes bacterium]|nr:ATP-binding protein [Candidatus Aminicenantes bacterium]HPB55112.1 ATP-binding protein [Candidatus Aminicenantes bacterium]HPT00315.1 ATP-binding protein [Candidatus Aminicenantes bacterium]